MALRNLFDGLAEEGTLRKILGAVNFARDSADRMRVSVDAGSSVAVYPYWGNAGNEPSQWTTGAVFAMDARQMAAYAARTNSLQVRNRWTFT